MLDELLKSYRAKKKESDDNYEVMRQESKKIEERISVLEKQIERLKIKKIELENNYYDESPSWVDLIVKLLMKELEIRTNLYGEIYGPFGLTCQTSIFLKQDMNKSIADQKTLCLTLRSPHKNRLYYETGEVKDTYPEGSIGALNGMGNVLAPVPNSMDDILSILHGDVDLLDRKSSQIGSFQTDMEKGEHIETKDGDG